MKSKTVLIASGLLSLAVGVTMYASGWLSKIIMTEKAKSHVKLYLRDPDSAQFRNLKFNLSAVCGQVNSKNGFGGRDGYMEFILLSDKDEFHYIYWNFANEEQKLSWAKISLPNCFNK